MGSKADAHWVWAALGVDTRQVVAVVAGDRSEVTARALWDAPPAEYRGAAAVVPPPGTCRVESGDRPKSPQLFVQE